MTRSHARLLTAFLLLCVVCVAVSCGSFSGGDSGGETDGGADARDATTQAEGDSAVGSANALELLRRYSTTLQHQFNTTLTNLQKLEKRQAAQLRDRDLPYQKPECAPIEEEPSSSPDHANASQQTTVESDEAPQPAAAEPPTTTQPIHAETSKQTNPRRPATTSPTRTVPNVPSSGQEKRR